MDWGRVTIIGGAGLVGAVLGWRATSKGIDKVPYYDDGPLGLTRDEYHRRLIFWRRVRRLIASAILGGCFASVAAYVLLR